MNTYIQSEVHHTYAHRQPLIFRLIYNLLRATTMEKMETTTMENR